MLIVFLFQIISCSIISLLMQKFDFLNNLFSKNKLIYLLLALSFIAYFHMFYQMTLQNYNTIFFWRIVLTSFSVLISILSSFIIAYITNSALSKFNFSLKNKTLKSTSSVHILITCFFWTSIVSNTL